MTVRAAAKWFVVVSLGCPLSYGMSWLSVPSAPVAGNAERAAKRAADGTSWFASTVTNAGEVVSATWTVAGLGVFEVYMNGHRVGDDFLKPGFTSADKMKYTFSYDVTTLLKSAKGESNVLAASVSSGWWRDQIAGFAGKKSAFHGDLLRDELRRVDRFDSSSVFVCVPRTGVEGVGDELRWRAVNKGEERV